MSNTLMAPPASDAERTSRVQNALTHLFDMALEKMGNDPKALLVRGFAGQVRAMISDLSYKSASEMSEILFAVNRHVNGDPIPRGARKHA